MPGLRQQARGLSNKALSGIGEANLRVIAERAGRETWRMAGPTRANRRRELARLTRVQRMVLPKPAR